MSKFNKLSDCFTTNGNFIIPGFDPYRTAYNEKGEKSDLWHFLFDNGHVKYRNEICHLISKNKWGVFSDAVKYYYAGECMDANCKGNYSAIYAWR